MAQGFFTYRIQQSYNDTQLSGERMERVIKEATGQPMKEFMYFYGAGDHGGGATKENIKSIEALEKEKGAPAVFLSTPEHYFEEITKKIWIYQRLKTICSITPRDVIRLTLNIKKGNRQSEAALVAAEKITALGNLIWGATYPKKKFTSAWQRVLFLQFHDSLAGTSLPVHYTETAREGYGFAQDTAHQAAYKAIQKLEWQIPAEDPDSQYIVVFNPHAWETKQTVEYDFNWDSNRHKSSRVEDEQGNPLAHQWALGTTEAGSRKKLITEVTLPPLGYRQFRLLDAESPVIKKE